MAYGDPQLSGKATPSNPVAPPAASGLGTTLGVAPQDMPKMPDQYPGQQAAQAAPATSWTSDPIYQLALGQNETAVKNAQAAALTSRIQALIAYGDPNLALAVTGDQNVAAAAAANKGSTLARLVADNAANVRNTNETENQNNLFYSSDRGYQLGLAQQAYLNQSSDALSGVQGQLGSISSKLLADEQAAYGNEAAAAGDAYNRAVQNPVGAPTSTPPPTTTTTKAPAAKGPAANPIPPTGQSGYAQASKANLH